MGTILTVLIAVLVFGFLIFAHELGHFLAARAFGVKIYEFSIGMGPALFTTKKKAEKKEKEKPFISKIRRSIISQELGKKRLAKTKLSQPE